MHYVDDNTYAYITTISEEAADVTIVRYMPFTWEILEEEEYGPFDSPQTCIEHAQTMGIPASRIIDTADLKPVGR